MQASTAAYVDGVKHAAPAGWLIAWIAGLHLDTWTTVFSFICVAWVLADKVRERIIKPWLAKRRAKTAP